MDSLSDCVPGTDGASVVLASRASDTPISDGCSASRRSDGITDVVPKMSGVGGGLR